MRQFSGGLKILKDYLFALVGWLFDGVRSNVFDPDKVADALANSGTLLNRDDHSHSENFWSARDALVTHGSRRRSQPTLLEPTIGRSR